MTSGDLCTTVVKLTFFSIYQLLITSNFFFRECAASFSLKKNFFGRVPPAFREKKIFSGVCRQLFVEKKFFREYAASFL